MQFDPKSLLELRKELAPYVDDQILNDAIQFCNEIPANIEGDGLIFRLGKALSIFNRDLKLDDFLRAIADANPNGATDVVKKWRTRLASASKSSSDKSIDAHEIEDQTRSPTPIPHDESIFAGRVNKILMSSMLIGLFSWFLARSPGTTGAIPAPIYAILFTPAVLTILLGLALIENKTLTDQHPQRRRVQVILASLTAALCWIVSLQYFIILAPLQPVDLCATRPNYDLLFRDVPLQRITHCMGKAEAFNASAPSYLKHQYLQAWSHIALPALATFFAFRIWRQQTGNVA